MFKMFCMPMIALILGACGSSGDNSAPTSNTGEAPVIQTGLIKNQEITTQGIKRTYHIFVPSVFTNSPIVFLFHGYGNSNDGILGLDGKASPYEVWLEIAQREKLIIVVPNGLDTGTEKGWNDCRNDAIGNSLQDDVRFVRDLIDVVVEKYQANAKRVYATGTSNGGHFSIRLGIEMYDKLTAFAAIAAANSVNTKCIPSVVPISALFMNGTADPLLPYTGGQMTGDRGEVFSAADTISDWVNRDKTETNPMVFSFPDEPSTEDNSSVSKHSFLNGTNNTEVVLYRIDGGGHNEPSIKIKKENSAGDQNRDIEMAEEVWTFFKNKSQ